MAFNGQHAQLSASLSTKLINFSLEIATRNSTIGQKWNFHKHFFQMFIFIKQITITELFFQIKKKQKDTD